MANIDRMLGCKEQLAATMADLVAARRMLRNCGAALTYVLSVMPHDDPLYRKTEVTMKAALKLAGPAPDKPIKRKSA